MSESLQWVLFSDIPTSLLEPTYTPKSVQWVLFLNILTTFTEHTHMSESIDWVLSLNMSPNITAQAPMDIILNYVKELQIPSLHAIISQKGYFTQTCGQIAQSTLTHKNHIDGYYSQTFR